MATAFSEATLRGIEPRYKEKFDVNLQNFTGKTGGNVSMGLFCGEKKHRYRHCSNVATPIHCPPHNKHVCKFNRKETRKK